MDQLGTTTQLNELERIRVRLGISRPEMLEMIGGRLGREGPFICPNANIDPIFLRRAYQLETLYNRWKAKILREVDQYERLSVLQLTQIMGTYPVKLLRLRSLGMLGQPDDRTTWSAIASVLTPADVHRLFALNEQYLNERSAGRNANRRAPLSKLFITWLRREQSSFLREVQIQQRIPQAV